MLTEVDGDGEKLIVMEVVGKINPSHFLDILFLFWGSYHVHVVKNVIFVHFGLF